MKNRKKCRKLRAMTESDKDYIFGAISVADSMDDLPDGAWWAVMEDLASKSIKQLSVQADPFDLVHEYLASKNQ